MNNMRNPAALNLSPSLAWEKTCRSILVPEVWDKYLIAGEGLRASHRDTGAVETDPDYRPNFPAF